MVQVDKDSVREAYMDVRDDSTDTNWALFGYQEENITTLGKGTDFDELKSHFADTERLFAFLRVFTGDELSKRAKFTLITWSGNSVSPIKRARISADKSMIKEIVQSYACDLMFSEPSEMNEEAVKDTLKKAGGANYGSGN